MAKYRVLEKSFINNTIVEAGEEIEYSGEIAANLELIEEAKGKKSKASASDAPADGGDLV